MFRKLLVHEFHAGNIYRRVNSRIASNKAVTVTNVDRGGNGSEARQSQADDFFGIQENESDKVQISISIESDNVTYTSETDARRQGDGIQETTTSDQTDALGLGSLLEKRPGPGLEKVLDVRFGYMRRDSDNPRRLKARGRFRRSDLPGDETYNSAQSVGDAAFLTKLMSQTLPNKPDQTEQLKQVEPLEVVGKHTVYQTNCHNYSKTNNVLSMSKGTDSDSVSTISSENTEKQSFEHSYFDEQYFEEIETSLNNTNAKLSTDIPVDTYQRGQHTAADRVDMSYIEGQYFGGHEHPNKRVVTHESDVAHITETNMSRRNYADAGKNTDKCYIDEQYFGKYPGAQNMPFLTDNFQEQTQMSGFHPGTNLVDQQGTNDAYAGVYVKKINDTHDKNTVFSHNVKPGGDQLIEETMDHNPAQDDFLNDVPEKIHVAGSNTYNNRAPKNLKRYDEVKLTGDRKMSSWEGLTDTIPHGQNNIHVVAPQTKQAYRLQNTLKPNLTEPKTAYDMVMKIRLEKRGRLTQSQALETKVGSSGTKLDSKGFRILKGQVPEWSRTPKEVLAKILRDSVIYDKDDIVVIDKPYGIPSHGGPGVAVSVGQLTPLLAQLLDQTGNLENLHLVHRLDKETTGVMILAKTAKVAWRLHGMFQRREVTKKYWLITKGVPSPTEGIINIPMAESSINGIHKMTLRPEHNEETKHAVKKSRLKTSEAITHFRVLDSQGNCALVECQPETGVKHQIRAHMAYGLNTPVLGDHKYSHYAKLAPQKLYPDLLQRLGIRQTKVRHLAMHLHAKVLVLPEFLNGTNLFLSARLPSHFTVNMKRLKLKPPR